MKLSILLFIMGHYFGSSDSLPEATTFSNPISEQTIRHFSFGRVGDFYYLVLPAARSKGLEVFESPFLTNFRFAKKQVIYKAPAGYSAVYPTGSLFQHNGQLYLYFQMSDSVDERIFVMKADHPSNPMGTWGAPIRLVDQIWDIHSRFGSVLEINEQLYFTWVSSGQRDNKSLAIYMAQMTSPTELIQPFVLLREPTEEWECYGGCVSEAPVFIRNRETVYLVYSASNSGNIRGCLSYMSIQNGQDPMNPANWIPAGQPVFVGSEDEGVFSPVFPRFTTSFDGTETWMLYSASSNSSNIYGEAALHIEIIEWNITTGSPIFPGIHGSKSLQPLPSGEPPQFKNPLLPGPLETFPYYSLFWDQNVYNLLLPTPNKSEIVLSRSNSLYDFDEAEKYNVFTAPNDSSAYASNVISYGGEIHVYLTMSGSGTARKIYHTTPTNSSDITQPWSSPNLMLTDAWEDMASSGAAMVHDGRLYFVWTSGDADAGYSLYIAKMESPTKVVPPAILLRKPFESWECSGLCVVEFPNFLQKNNVTYLVFSSSYAFRAGVLSLMSIESGRNPLDVTNWYMYDGPVFGSNLEEQSYVTSMPTFTSSPDNTETWLTYVTSTTSENDTMRDYDVRLDKLKWSSDNKPRFPKPHGLNQPQPIPSRFEYFQNPILDSNITSPGIFRLGSFYYLTCSENGNTDLVILKSGKLTNFTNAERRTLYRSPSGYGNLLAPKMHLVDGKLCIYFSMQYNDNEHRLFVITAEDPKNPMGRWGTPVRLLENTWSLSSFHPTVVTHANSNYLTWISLRPATGLHSIYIAEMENSTSVKEPIVLIREPRESWECDGGCSDAAPFAIHNQGMTYIVHSVGSSCGGANGLTWMSIPGEKDPLDVFNWILALEKVFGDNEEQDVYCPGYATFTQSPNGQETWMVFHAATSQNSGDAKNVHIEKIFWNADGSPNFPKAHGIGQRQVVPAKKKFDYHHE